MILRSILYGYLGAIAAGIIVAIVGLSFSLSTDTIVAISGPTGIIFGLIGLSLPILSRYCRPS